MMRREINGRNRKRRREAWRPRVVVAAGLAALAVVGVFAVIGLRAPSGVPLRDYKKVFVSFADAGNLQPRNEVRIKGVRVGQVLAVRPQRGRGVAELQLDPGTGDLPSDTTAALRARGLLGARYVELIPGSAPTRLPDRATIIAPRNALSFGVPETLETFDAETRNALGRLLRALGTGLLGRGDELNAALAAGPRPANEFPRVIDTLLARDGAVRRLAPSLRRGAGTLDSAGDDIAGAVAATADGLTPFSERREALRNTLAEAPPTLDAARSGLGEGRRLVGAVRALARAATEALPSAPAGLRQASALLREARTPLVRTRELLREVRPTVSPTIRLTDGLSPLLPPLRRALGSLTPLVGTLGDYGCEIDNFAENWRSALGYGVDTPSGGAMLPSGRIGALQGFRIVAFGGPQALHDVTTPRDARAERDPYPHPCKYAPGSPYPAVKLAEEGSP